jgi:hypothetical protein
VSAETHIANQGRMTAGARQKMEDVIGLLILGTFKLSVVLAQDSTCTKLCIVRLNSEEWLYIHHIDKMSKWLEG